MIHQATLALLFAALTSCVVIIHKVELLIDKKIANVTTSLYNDYVNDFVLNHTIRNFVVVETMMIYGKVFLQQDEGDVDYKKEIITGVFDLEKTLRRANKDFVLKSILEAVTKSAEFEFKFPFKKSVYTLTNITVSDKYVPIAVLHPTKFMIYIRIVGRIQGKKSPTFFGVAKYYGELARSERQLSTST